LFSYLLEGEMKFHHFLPPLEKSLATSGQINSWKTSADTPAQISPLH